jgi:nicotinate-nucleotide pyrophosphorylase (carboxylating)
LEDWISLNPIYLRKLVESALCEDLGPTGDISTEAVLVNDHPARGVIIAKQPGCLAGNEAAILAFKTIDPHLDVWFAPEGSNFKKGDIIAIIKGSAKSILKAERVALNFLGHLCGIATITQKAVELVKPYGVKIVDTRKTMPGLRALEKHAVKMGGGYNHRFGLFDAVLLKENHIFAAGGIKEAVSRVKSYIGHMVKIELEIETLDQLQEALEAEVDVILLDNMSLDEVRKAVQIAKGRVIIEASGNITLENITQVAACRVDYISMGFITHSAPVIDLSLRIDG